MSTLAINGGPPTLLAPSPHADRLAFTDNDREAIFSYLNVKNAPNSIFGCEDIVAEYEKALALFFCRRYCLLTNSGTNALHTAFFAIGIGPGDEVICPTYTFQATVTPLFQLGAIPVLVDGEADTGNLDPRKIEEQVTAKTRAVVVTHQWGHPADLPELRQLTRRHKLALVEDVSLGIGASIDGVRAGTFGDVACFSLGSTKMLSGGQGGALVVDDQSLWERANLLGHFGRRCFDTISSPAYRQFAETGYGHNNRMHVLAVAMSYSRFRRLELLVSQRKARFDRLSECLEKNEFVGPQITREGVTRGSWQGYCAVYRGSENGISIDRFVRALRAEGLEVQARGYQTPLHWKRAFQTASDGSQIYSPGIVRRTYKRGDFPQVERHIETSIGFPLFLDEDMQLIDAYGRACRKVAERAHEIPSSPDGRARLG